MRPATVEEIKAAGMEPGYGSPIGARNTVVVIDDLVARSPNLVAGANREGYHYRNVNVGRDFSADVTAVAWVTTLSGDPPLVGVALSARTFIHELIRRSEEFTINVPPADLARQVHHCGTVSGADEDKWAATGLHTTSARQVEAPWIEECMAHLECGVVEVVPVGDHDLFVAQVLVAWADDHLRGGIL